MVVGAIAGNCIGVSRAKVTRAPKNAEDVQFFDKFADIGPPTVFLMAVCKSISLGKHSFAQVLTELMDTYKHIDYGMGLMHWKEKGDKVNKDDILAAVVGIPYGWVYADADKAAEVAKAACHDVYIHQTSKKAAFLTAGCISSLRTGGKKEMRKWYRRNTEAQLEDFSLHAPKLRRTDRCCTILPYAIKAFLEGAYFEESLMSGIYLNIQTPVSLAIIGGLAEACYKDGASKWIQEEVQTRLDGSDYKDLCCFLSAHKIPHAKSLGAKASKLFGGHRIEDKPKIIRRTPVSDVNSRRSIDQMLRNENALNGKAAVNARRSLDLNATTDEPPSTRRSLELSFSRFNPRQRDADDKSYNSFNLRSPKSGSEASPRRSFFGRRKGTKEEGGRASAPTGFRRVLSMEISEDDQSSSRRGFGKVLSGRGFFPA